MHKILIGMLALLLISTCGYRTLQAKEEQTNRAWSDLGFSCRQRMERAAVYMEAVQRHVSLNNEVVKEAEKALQKAVKEGYPLIPPDGKRLLKFRQVQSELTLALARLHLSTGNSPVFLRDESFLAAQKRMETAEARLNEAITDYNLASHEFNLCKRSFPHALTNMLLLRYSDKQPFTAGEQVKLCGKIDS
ncbi:LemA family protein [Geotalea sp. SG265]|uniref:LemA family protein n=1 Tax=Geotalea sp. SG265 TaxID=2922867 RepID=UPI001FAE9BAE|nr:LemA family protein [Geotalea sp. SG265]